MLHIVTLAGLGDLEINQAPHPDRVARLMDSGKFGVVGIGVIAANLGPLGHSARAKRR